MACENHPDRPVYASCSTCGALICEACALEVNGKTICKKCIDKVGALPKRAETPGHYHHEELRVPGRPGTNGLLVFLFSFLPGAAHMYMGLMKKGLTMLIAFFLGSALIANLPLATLGCGIAVLVILSVFDAMHTRRQIIAGVPVQDDIEGAINFVKSNRYLFMLIVGVVAFEAVGSIVSDIFYWSGSRSIIIVALALIGVFFLLGRKKTAPRKGEDSVDYRDQQ